MIDELKPCPFCGSEADKHPIVDAISCLNHDCSLGWINIESNDWQSRPIEDALRSKLDMAVEALEKICQKIKEPMMHRTAEEIDYYEIAQEALCQIKEEK